ncbi:MAG: DUF5685 family protein [Ardenticatenaceae bacterium]
MFGVLKGASCAMKPEERQEWMGHICGVCLSLRDNYGHAARITTNYDAALLSVLCEAQSEASTERYTSYCPLRSNFKSDVVAPSSAAAGYAASIALTMGATKIEDHVEDNETFLRRIPNVSRQVAQTWREASQKRAQGLGFDTSRLVAQTSRQAAIEATPQQDFFYYAQPTELAVASAFQHTATIAARPQNSDILHEMGRVFGRIMYLLDSYEDYDEDLAKNKFNALAAAFAPDEIDAQAEGIFRQSHNALKRLFSQLDLPRPTLARKLLVTQLKQRGFKVLNLGGCASGSCRLPKAEAQVGGASSGILGIFGSRKRRKKHKRRKKKLSNFCSLLICCDCCTDCCCCCDCDVCECEDGGCEICECECCGCECFDADCDCCGGCDTDCCGCDGD